MVRDWEVFIGAHPCAAIATVIGPCPYTLAINHALHVLPCAPFAPRFAVGHSERESSIANAPYNHLSNIGEADGLGAVGAAGMGGVIWSGG